MNGRAAAALLFCALAAATPGSAPLESGVDLSSLDRAVRPQDDLYRFANGAWLDRTAIPPDRVSYGVFAELSERVETDLRQIIETLDGRTPAERKIQTLYRSVMDEARIEEIGLASVAPVLGRIAAIDSAKDVAAECGRLSASGGGGPFHASPGVDARDPRRIIIHVTQGGTLLPDRSYYFEPHGEGARRGYEDYVATLLRIAGHARPEAAAQNVLALETTLARAQVPQAGSRVSLAHAQAFTLAELHAAMPGFDWKAWAGPQGLDRAASFILGQPAFFAAFAEQVARVPLDTWKAWLTTRYLTAVAPFTVREIHEARFELFGRILTGQEVPRVRWKQGVALVNSHMGDALGRLYVERHLHASARKRVGAMVEHLVAAFRAAIEDADWLSPPTRSRARAKISELEAQIGRPDRWRSYDALDVRHGDLMGNVERAQRFETVYQATRLLRRVEPDHWPVTPQTVNAIYLPWRNRVLVPAAMLQPPLFDEAAEDAANYGALGAMIAHEMAHAFDGQGRRYDGFGAASDWWTAADIEAYDRRARRLAEQFNAYPAGDGVRMNGEATLAENAGDLAGLSIAVRAYRLSLRGKPSPVIDGFTGEQRLFIRWAQMWRTLIRPEYLRQTVLTNHHAPGHHRANGAALNLDAFHQAFGVSPADKLYLAPARRVRLW